MDLPTFLSSAFGLTTEPQQQAAITGLLQMLGVFVTGMAALATFVLTQRATRRRDDRLHQAERERGDWSRSERMRDLQIALRAEIRIFVLKYEAFDFDGHRDEIVRKIHEGSPTSSRGFTPFVPKTTDLFVWGAVAKNIPILPGAVIEPVILYYDMLRALGLLVDDMRGDGFRELEADRKAAIYEAYVEMLKKLTHHATLALSALDGSLESGNAQ